MHGENWSEDEKNKELHIFSLHLNSIREQRFAILPESQPKCEQKKKKNRIECSEKLSTVTQSMEKYPSEWCRFCWLAFVHSFYFSNYFPLQIDRNFMAKKIN